MTSSDGNREEFGGTTGQQQCTLINNREHQAPDGPQQEHKSGQPDSGNNQGRPGQEMKYTKNSKCLLEVAKGMAERRCVVDSLGTKRF